MRRLGSIILLVSFACGGFGWAVGPESAPGKSIRRTQHFASKRIKRISVGYMDGKTFVQHGPDVFYYDRQGSPKNLGLIYLHGKREGKCVGWYSNGRERERGAFSKDKRDGVWTTNHENGARKQEVTYVNDEPHGTLKVWAENGTLITERSYQHGTKQGPERRSYPDGKPKSQVSWLDGELHGVAKSWYPDGSPKMVVTFDRGKKTGQLQEWYESGQLRLQATYLDDELEGPYAAYGKGGNLFGKGTMKGGHILSGTFREAGFMPNHYWVSSYQDGEIVDGVLYENGQLKNDVVTEHHVNGVPMRRYMFEEGKKNGEELWWHPNQQLHKQMKWVDNKLVGSYTEWWPDGANKMVTTYKDGVLDGIETRWDQRGRIIARGEYREGKPWEGAIATVLEDGSEALQTYKEGRLIASPGEVEGAEKEVVAEVLSDGRERVWKTRARTLTAEESARLKAGDNAAARAPMQASPIHDNDDD